MATDQEDKNDQENMNIIKSLEHKAEVMREIHVSEYETYKKRCNIFSMIITTSSVIVISLSVTDPTLLGMNDAVVDKFRTFTAFFGLLIFIISLYDKVYGICDKCADHEQAMKLLTEFITESKKFRKSEMSKCTENEISLNITYFQKKYSQITQVIPTVTNDTKKFLKLKQNYLVKRELSKKLDDNPFLDIEKELKSEKMKSCQFTLKELENSENSEITS